MAYRFVFDFLFARLRCAAVRSRAARVDAANGRRPNCADDHGRNLNHNAVSDSLAVGRAADSDPAVQ
jgi:hypothetical protein